MEVHVKQSTLHKRWHYQLYQITCKELGPSNVRVNCVAPGVVRTDMMLNHFTEEEIAQLCQRIPLAG